MNFEMKEKMTEIYGSEGMRKSPSRDELYDCVDVLADALALMKQRLDTMEATSKSQTDDKPRIRIAAGSERV